MILVFGGAYQGKTEYAQKELGAQTVCDVSDGAEPDFTKEVITGLDGFASECVRKGIDPVEYFKARQEQWKTCVLVSTDISQGVVPIDPELRAAREACGRLLIYLAKEAEQVHRVFCGIGKRIK